MSPILAKPEVKVERDPRCLPASTINLPEALEMLADMDSALDEKEKALDIISTQHKADMMALRKHHEEDFAAMQSNLDRRATDRPEKSGQNQNSGHLAETAPIQPEFLVLVQK